MSRDWHLYLDDILTSVKKVMNYIQGLDMTQFVQDDKTFDAVVRNLEIIGEAIKNIPREELVRYPDVDWRGLAGLRDIISHKYFGLDIGILWDVACNEMPLLQQAVMAMITEADESNLH